MLRSLDELEKGFKNLSEKSKKDCGSKLEEMRQLAFESGNFFAIFYDFQKKTKGKYGVWGHSLYHTCLLELFRKSVHILFLFSNGLYRNAFDDVRHTLESIVQAIYLDNRHPNASLRTKIEILKEIEDNREYHAVRLIDELKLAHKDKLKAEYKELSRTIHPSHKQIEALLRDIKTDEGGVPTTVDCEEISRIYESMKRMYDIFFFLLLNYLPELKETTKNDSHFIKAVRLYNLGLVAEAIGIKL
jgi:hypothetical protein